MHKKSLHKDAYHVKLSIDDICKLVGVSRATYYRVIKPKLTGNGYEDLQYLLSLTTSQ